MSLLTFSCSSKAQEQTMNASRQSEKKILVAYFSCTGTTERVADAIAQAVSGKLYQITPAAAYTSQTLIGIIRQAAVLWKWRMKPHAPRWAEKRSICKITMWYSSAIRYGGMYVHAQSIPSLRSTTSGKAIIRSLLPVAVQ